ncbi:PLD nuclease N-terminal domain-containing protein [Microbacterium sp. CCNWLW134]|uniref:PLD nuclease N-terminal domain-containing protein n=1 Tax=Microbacterium sp. CCNWLW134 TaxID=3122064 RepID=UPI0030104495
MTRVLLIAALLATVFWVYSIVDCALQPPNRHRGVSKPIWILIVILLPVLGGALWFVVGRLRKKTIAARRAPDDDPEFLGRIGSISDQDERIRRLEEELAQLDAEADDPRYLPPEHGAAPDNTIEPPSSGRDRSARTGERPADDDDPLGTRGPLS